MSNRRQPQSHTGAVTLAYVHSNEVAHSWHASMMGLVAHDMAHDGRLMRGGWIAVRCGTDGLPASRNEVARQFLDTDSEWLFWIDTDMGFDSDIVDQLLEAADPAERPVVGALCFAQREMTPDGAGGYHCQAAPTIYDWMASGERQGFVARRMYDMDALTRCSGTGSAAILIHRTVLEQIREQFGPVWYDRAPEAQPDPDGTRRMMGEDLSFCMRAGVVGVPVHVHTGIKTTHLKNVWLSEDDYLDQFAADRLRHAAIQSAADAESAGDAESVTSA